MENQASEIKNNNSNKLVVILGIIVVILVMALAAVLAFFKPDMDKKDEKAVTPTPAPTDTLITDDEEEFDDSGYDIPILSTDSEEIKIAKTKLKQSFNFFGGYCKSDETYDKDDGYLCYYATLDEFKKQFYSVYSSKLDYKDVYVEYDGEKLDTNLDLDDNYTAIAKYGIKNNKVYKSSCSVGTGGFSRMDKFTLESKTDNLIKINYVEMGYVIPELYEESGEQENGKATIILVKENGDWKILKATIVNQCGGTYEIGKES